MPSDDPTVEARAAAVDAAPVSGEGARLARASDAAELVRLRARMFDAMGVDAGVSEWQERCRAHVAAHLRDGTLIGAVVDGPASGRLVASALAELATRLPSPSNPTGSFAYLSSVSTEPGWRQRGLARSTTTLLLEELDARGVQRVELHATADAAALYRALGFVARGGGEEMRLRR